MAHVGHTRVYIYGELFGGEGVGSGYGVAFLRRVGPDGVAAGFPLGRFHERQYVGIVANLERLQPFLTVGQWLHIDFGGIGAAVSSQNACVVGQSPASGIAAVHQERHPAALQGRESVAEALHRCAYGSAVLHVHLGHSHQWGDGRYVEVFHVVARRLLRGYEIHLVVACVEFAGGGIGKHIVLSADRQRQFRHYVQRLQELVDLQCLLSRAAVDVAVDGNTRNFDFGSAQIVV